MSSPIKAFSKIAWLLAAATLLATFLMAAEVSREAYRAAYRKWRTVDTALERDAATAGAPLGSRADRVAAEAVKFSSERRAFVDQFSQENAQKLPWLETPVDAGLSVTSDVSAYIAAETAGVRRGVDTFANDPDSGIQKIRALLERENVTLTALSAAVATRQKAAADADRAAATIEEARKKAVDLNHEFAADLKRASDELALETAAWTEYYRKLSEGARGTSATPVSTIPANSGSSRPIGPDPRPPSQTALPLIRYTGDWIFPTAGLYHGPQPEFVDLVVRETNGHCDGRMVARFMQPSVGAADPVLRFEFSGEFKSGRIQTFELQTSDGSKGTIDLIPGGAFNLLEINVQIAAKPGKVKQVNVVLIKK